MLAMNPEYNYDNDPLLSNDKKDRQLTRAVLLINATAHAARALLTVCVQTKERKERKRERGRKRERKRETRREEEKEEEEDEAEQEKQWPH